MPSFFRDPMVDREPPMRHDSNSVPRSEQFRPISPSKPEPPTNERFDDENLYGDLDRGDSPKLPRGAFDDRGARFTYGESINHARRMTSHDRLPNPELEAVKWDLRRLAKEITELRSEISHLEQAVIRNEKKLEDLAEAEDQKSKEMQGLLKRRFALEDTQSSREFGLSTGIARAAQRGYPVRSHRDKPGHPRGDGSSIRDLPLREDDF